MKSHDWNKKQVLSASKPNYGKKYVDQPNFLKLIGLPENKKILEFGSGNGYWLELLSRKGGICTGVELSLDQIELARQKNKSNNITYIQGDITKLDTLKLLSGSFDLILINHVLLEISTKKKLENIFINAKKFLKKDGKIVISELHPFATSSKTKNIKLPSGFHYFKSGEVFEIISQRIDGEKIFYKDFHWTLSDITNAITGSGLVITKIIEPKPSKKQSDKYESLKYRLEQPMSIMITASK